MAKNLLRKIFRLRLLILCLVFINTPVYAYLDPGTGSVLLNLIIGMFAVTMYSIRGFFYGLSGFIKRGKWDRSLADPEADIVFYSEGGNYLNVFLPVIQEFEKNGVASVYYTSDENDPGLDMQFDFCKASFIGDKKVCHNLLNRLRAKIVVMTTPQLDVMNLRRSDNVAHYCHLIHAPTDALVYKKFAFDYFDSVLCSGTHQKTSIRALESKRGLPQKILLDTGLTYMDVMAQEMEQHPTHDKGLKTVLVAPTWGSNGLLDKYGSEPVKNLLKAGFHVILRPHPQMFVSGKKLMEQILNELSDYKNLEIDRNPSGNKSMAAADLLVSDISGIIFDFAFVCEKPVVVLEGKIDPGGLEAEDVSHDPWEVSSIQRIARVVEAGEIDNIAEIVSEELGGQKKADTLSVREESIFNYPFAGPVAAKQIQQLIADI